MGDITGEYGWHILCPGHEVCHTWYQCSMDDTFGVKDVIVVCFA